MRLTRIVLPLTLLAALALTTSAFAQSFGWGGETNHYITESYYTDLGNGVYRYDYVLWYENWDAANNDWAPQTDDADYFILEWPSGWGTSGVDDMFVDAGIVNDDGAIALATGTDGLWEDLPDPHPSATLDDNTYFNGAVRSVTFDGFSTYVGNDGNTYRGWRWWFNNNSSTSEKDASTDVDYHGTGYQENKDAAVRNNYFGALDNWASNNSDLNAEWSTYIKSSDSGYANLETWAPLTYQDTPEQQAFTGYNRPIAWLWIELKAPPAVMGGDVGDSGDNQGYVWGPTPELNASILLLLTLLPGALLFLRRE